MEETSGKWGSSGREARGMAAGFDSRACADGVNRWVGVACGRIVIARPLVVGAGRVSFPFGRIGFDHLTVGVEEDGAGERWVGGRS